MTILGVVALPGVPPERLASLAAVAEGARLDELWLWEDCFYAGSVAAAATMLAATARIRIGIGVQPVPLRAAPLAAMELAALDRIAPGRLVPGFGHGVQEWMAQVGVKVESPLTLLREYVTAVGALLAGEEVSVQGRYVRLDRVRLDWPPTGALPLHVGTEGPRSLAVSAQVADGTILPGGSSPERVREVRALLDDTARAAGRTGPHRLTVFCAVPPDAGPGPAADTVRGLAGAGADAVVLMDPSDERDDEAFARFVGTQVAPLV